MSVVCRDSSVLLLEIVTQCLPVCRGLRPCTTRLGRTMRRSMGGKGPRAFLLGGSWGLCSPSPLILLPVTRHSQNTQKSHSVAMILQVLHHLPEKKCFSCTLLQRGDHDFLGPSATGSDYVYDLPPPEKYKFPKRVVSFVRSCTSPSPPQNISLSCAVFLQGEGADVAKVLEGLRCRCSTGPFLQSGTC